MKLAQLPPDPQLRSHYLRIAHYNPRYRNTRLDFRQIVRWKQDDLKIYSKILIIIQFIFQKRITCFLSWCGVGYQRAQGLLKRKNWAMVRFGKMFGVYGRVHQKCYFKKKKNIYEPSFCSSKIYSDKKQIFTSSKVKKILLFNWASFKPGLICRCWDGKKIWI